MVASMIRWMGVLPLLMGVTGFQIDCPFDSSHPASPCHAAVCSDQTVANVSSSCVSAAVLYCAENFNDPACSRTTCPYEDKWSMASPCQQSACNTSKLQESLQQEACSAAAALYCTWHPDDLACQPCLFSLNADASPCYVTACASAPKQALDCTLFIQTYCAGEGTTDVGCPAFSSCPFRKDLPSSPCYEAELRTASSIQHLGQAIGQHCALHHANDTACEIMLDGCAVMDAYQPLSPCLDYKCLEHGQGSFACLAGAVATFCAWHPENTGCSIQCLFSSSPAQSPCAAAECTGLHLSNVTEVCFTASLSPYCQTFPADSGCNLFCPFAWGNTSSPCLQHSACWLEDNIPHPSLACVEAFDSYCESASDPSGYCNSLEDCPFDDQHSLSSPCRHFNCSLYNNYDRNQGWRNTESCLSYTHEFCEQHPSDTGCSDDTCPFVVKHRPDSPCQVTSCRSLNLSHPQVVPLGCCEYTHRWCLEQSPMDTGCYGSLLERCEVYGLVLPSPTCTDNVKNGGETGLDCGGPCPRCEIPCSAGFDPAGGWWSTTNEGEVATAPCGSGKQGHVVRICCGSRELSAVGGDGVACTASSYGHWMVPTYENCSRYDIQLLLGILQTTDLGNKSQTTELLQKMVNATAVAATTLGLEDIETTTTVLKTVLQVVNTSVATVEGQDFIRLILRTVDNTLLAGKMLLRRLADGNPAQMLPNILITLTEKLYGSLAADTVLTLNGERVVLTLASYPTNNFLGASWPPHGTVTNVAVQLPAGIFDTLSASTGKVGVMYYDHAHAFPSAVQDPVGPAISVTLDGYESRGKIALAQNITFTFAINMSSAAVKNRLCTQLGDRCSPCDIDVDIQVDNQLAITCRSLLNPALAAQVACSWWDDTTGGWSTEGCFVVETTQTSVMCTCNHLTSFAVLVDVADAIEPTDTAAAEVLSIITQVGLSLSIACMLVVVLVYTWFYRTKVVKVPQKIVLHLCVALIGGQMAFLIGIRKTESPGCLVVAMAIHFFLLAAFLWMLTQAACLYTAFVQVLPGKRHLEDYFSYAVVVNWLGPAVLVTASAIFNRSDYTTAHYCWIDVHSGLILAFVVPLLLVISINVVVYVLVVMAIYRRTDLKVALKASLSFFCLLGVSWIFGGLVIVDPTVTSQFIFAICSTLQGVLLFFFHCWQNTNVWAALACCLPERKQPGSLRSESDTSWQTRGTDSTDPTHNKQHSAQMPTTASPTPGSPDIPKLCDMNSRAKTSPAGQSWIEIGVVTVTGRMTSASQLSFCDQVSLLMEDSEDDVDELQLYKQLTAQQLLQPQKAGQLGGDRPTSAAQRRWDTDVEQRYLLIGNEDARMGHAATADGQPLAVQGDTQFTIVPPTDGDNFYLAVGSNNLGEYIDILEL